MSLWVIRIIGAIIAVIGLLLIADAFGLPLGPHIPTTWLIEAVVGAVVVAFGAYMVYGKVPAP